MNLNVGQRVFMPRYGIARISGIESEVISGVNCDLYVTIFDRREDIISSTAMLNAVRKIPVRQAANRFIPLPSAKKFKSIIQIANGSAKKTSGLWKYNQERFDDMLASGDLERVAVVYSKLRIDVESGDPSLSKMALYDEALKTLSICYAEVTGIDIPSALAVFRPENISSNVAVADKPTADAEITSPTTYKKLSASSPSWDLPVELALKIADKFSASSKTLIAEKIKVKSLSELFKFTQGDWPLHAPTTIGIEREDAEMIQRDVATLVTTLQRSIA